MAMQIEMGLMQELQFQLRMTPQLRQSIELLSYSQAGLEMYLTERTPNYIPYSNRRDDSVGWEPADPRSLQPSLLQDLQQQLWGMNLPVIMEEHLRYLMHNLDERGFLRLTFTDFCKRFQDCDEHYFEYLVTILQSLEPAGVGARSIGELLSLQLNRKKPVPSLALVLVEKYLDQLAKKDWESLKRILGVSSQELNQAYQQILSCEPYPCINYLPEKKEYLVPDLEIEENEEGDWEVRLSERNLETLPIDYDHNSFLGQKPEGKTWLERAIYQSKLTLLRIAELIVKKQQAFFSRGKEGLIPLTMTEIAEELGLHPSTISRAIHQKYIKTPQGVFPLRTFFIGRKRDIPLPTILKKEIKKAIDRENKNKPLSDKKIAFHLQKKGIKISRRTISKYRLELGIPASAQRKREHLLANGE